MAELELGATIKNALFCLGWCGSVDCVSACELKGRGFESLSGRAHAWVVGQVPSRGHVRGNHLMFLSLSPSLPLSLKIKQNL